MAKCTSKLAKATNSILSSFRSLNPNKQKVLLACSGGADSIALAFVLSKSRKYLPFEVGHVTHDIRPEEETNKDFEAVKNICERIGVKMHHAKVYPKLNTKECGNLENAARKERFSALQGMCIKNECSLIVTAHHADDQLETMIMKIARGSGLRGLSGIASLKEGINGKPSFMRPMLHIEKSTCYDICYENGLDWNEDSTNSDNNITRNKIHNEIIPLIKEMFPYASRNANNLSQVVNSCVNVVSKNVKNIARSQKDTHSIPLETLHACEDIEIYEWFYNYVQTYNNGVGLDSMNKYNIDKILNAIRLRKIKNLRLNCDFEVEISKSQVRIVRYLK